MPAFLRVGIEARFKSKMTTPIAHAHPLKQCLKLVSVCLICFASTAVAKERSLEDQQKLTRLLKDQRWYSAKGHLEKFDDLSLSESETLKKLTKAIESQVYRDAAKECYSKKAYQACLLAIKKMDLEPNDPLLALKEKASIEVMIQDAQDLFFIGKAEEAILTLENVNAESVKELRLSIEKVLYKLDLAVRSTQDLRFSYARKTYQEVKSLIQDPQHAYWKKAHAMQSSLGSEEDIGIKMIAEGDRRLAENDGEGAAEAYEKALMNSPALAYKKLDDLKKLPLELYLEALTCYRSEPQKAEKLLARSLALAKNDEALIKRIKEKQSQLSSVTMDSSK